jgi:hypothetical protein
MSLAETKTKAFEKLALVQDEDVLRLVISYLETVNESDQKRVYNLSIHAGEIFEQYNETLKKLSQ